jgi:hypothetical protein|tara:strand:- start:1205 stop:1321 length:117 start_codon:yes stop_codon:yes gene_type:complete
MCLGCFWVKDDFFDSTSKTNVNWDSEDNDGVEDAVDKV